MASTYSNLKFELIGTGDQSGTWGTTTNTNLGTAIEQAIVGMATISSGFTGSPLTLTLTLTDTNAAQNARALVLNLTQSLGSAGTLNVPAIQKPYMIINATGQTVTVKVTGQTGVAVPTGTRTFLYNNGTDVGSFFNYAASLTLGTDLAVADGGTGASSAPAARTNLGASTVGSNLFTLTNPSAITFIRINADNTVTALSAADFRTAIGAGTGGGSVTSVATSNGPAPINGLTLTGGPITSTGTVTLGGGVNVSTITTGILPVANGGTGVNAAGTSGNVLTSNGTAWVSQAGPVAANIQTFSATGTYTKPTGAKFVMVEAWGAGAGGRAGGWLNFGSNGGSGGGGGGYNYAMFASPVVGSTETVTVGAGGTGGTGLSYPVPAPLQNANGALGTNGGTSNFGTLLYANGGSVNSVGFNIAPPNISGINGGFGLGRANTTLATSTSPFQTIGLYSGGFGGTAATSAVEGFASVFGGGGGGAGGQYGPINTTPYGGPVPAASFKSGAYGAYGQINKLAPSVPNVSRATPFGAAGPNAGDNLPGSPGGDGTAFNGGGGGGSAGGTISKAGNGGNGGNGGTAAGGGGGGGSAQFATAGNGGNGGNGLVVVYSW